MKKIRLLLEYDGTNYHGWQVQKDETTIQGIIEDRVHRITGEHSAVIGASRTDAGVHALRQVAAFRSESQLDPASIRRALNAVLPRDIRVLEASYADEFFHPRQDARKKRYFYIIANQRISPAFLFRYAWIVPQSLDMDSIIQASRFFIGRHDFSSFMGTGSDIKDPVREVYSLNIGTLEQIDFMTAGLTGKFIKISIEAEGFLRHMVRNIVGTLIETGRGRIPAERLKDILESGDRTRAGQTAPPQGLFLERIDY